MLNECCILLVSAIAAECGVGQNFKQSVIIVIILAKMPLVRLLTQQSVCVVLTRSSSA